MPEVFPFRAVQYQGGRGDVSGKVAPPYDVLDADAKAALIATDGANVVGVDLPQVPAKELGPPEAYSTAASTYQSWLEDGTLSQREEPAMFVYRQRFTFEGREYERTGMACTIETRAFGPRDGGGVLPHEQTFSGPKEDRFALMRAAACQFSPIFGLHADESGAATDVLRSLTEGRAPDMTADMGDGITHEVWTIDTPSDIDRYRQALAGEDVFVADGHHRYNTALNYLRSLEDQGEVPEDHPARRTMFVLVAMSDPGLAIGPTHRVLGGMSEYSFDGFRAAADGVLDVTTVAGGAEEIEGHVARMASDSGRPTLGFVDFESGSCAVLTPVDADPLAERFADKPVDWRTLDVALIQHVIVEGLCEPKLNGGESVKWAFPHSIDEVTAIGSGQETGAGGGEGFAQMAVIVRPTPLDAVKAISRAGELMPQKSTFFYPKLATGLFLNPLSNEG